MIKESDEKIKVEKWAYTTYIQAMGGFLLYFFIIVANFGVIYTQVYGTNLLLVWADEPTLAAQQERFGHFAVWITVFGVLTGTFTMIRVSLVVFGNLRAIKYLHNKMIGIVLSAPINLYFDITPIGQILNRFSKDLMVMDTSIMFAISGFFGCLFNLIASLTVALFVVPFIGIPIGMMLLMGGLIFWYSLEGYSQCYRLESITRTPILSLLQETISGSSVIRAFGMDKDFDAKNT
jgi:ABC-type multidrug transport system fused ATPase/permease subunit